MTAVDLDSAHRIADIHRAVGRLIGSRAGHASAYELAAVDDQRTVIRVNGCTVYLHPLDEVRELILDVLAAHVIYAGVDRQRAAVDLEYIALVHSHTLVDDLAVIVYLAVLMLVGVAPVAVDGQRRSLGDVEQSLLEDILDCRIGLALMLAGYAVAVVHLHSVAVQVEYLLALTHGTPVAHIAIGCDVAPCGGVHIRRDIGRQSDDEHS